MDNESGAHARGHGDNGGDVSGGSAGPASARPYPPPSIHQVCSAAANGGTLHGSVCVLPPGVATAPNDYSETIAVSKACTRK